MLFHLFKFTSTNIRKIFYKKKLFTVGFLIKLIVELIRKKIMKKLLLLLLLTPFLGLSQSLTGYDFSCKTMEILDPVKYSDEYYVIEETRDVDLKVSFYHNNIIIYDYVKQTSNIMNVTFMRYDEMLNADIYSLESPDEPGSLVFVFYELGMVNFCIEWIPEWNRYKNIYRLSDMTYIGYK